MSRPFESIRTWVSDRFRSNRRQASRAQRHIVLDMDETLVHTFENRKDLNSLKLFSSPRFFTLRSRIYVLQEPLWGATRPHLERFIQTCFDEFSTVTIWSAGEGNYVNDVVQRVFRGLPKPDLVLSRGNCLIDIAGLDQGEEIRKKPIYKVGEYYEELGRLDIRMDETNTLIVEDNPESIASEDRFNSVLIPEYSPEPTGEALLRDDRTLETLASWFSQDQFRRSSDVRYVSRPVFYSVPVPKNILRAEYVGLRGPKTGIVRWASQ